MIAVRLVLATAALGLVGASPAPESRSLFTVKEFPAFQVMVSAEKADWCGDTARITIVGQSAEQFSQNQAVVERIVGGLRAITSFECPQATKILISGKVQGQPIYQASASAAGNWKLENIEFRTAAQLQMLADLDTISKCDELGSGPGDPEAMSEGVEDDNLDGAEIVSVCGKAVALDGETPRLRYQFARGLLDQGNAEQAIEQLVPAGEAGHGGALALLGDVYLHGAGGMEADPTIAKGMYERAVEAGFEPAKQVLAAFEDQTAVLAKAEVEEKAFIAQAQQEARQASAPPPAAVRGLNTQGYEFPGVMNGIYTGEFDDIGGDRGVKIYLANMADAFRNVCRGSFTIAEVNNLKMSVIDRSDMSAEAGLGAIVDAFAMMATIAQNPGSMMDAAKNAQAAESLPAQANEDAMLFLERNNCGSAAFSRFTSNLREYMSGDSGLPANMSASQYQNACMAGAGSTHYTKGEFCTCFLARANSIGLSRTEKKGLLQSFWPTATRIMQNNSQHFGACNGAFAQ